MPLCIVMVICTDVHQHTSVHAIVFQLLKQVSSSLDIRMMFTQKQALEYLTV